MEQLAQQFAQLQQQFGQLHSMFKSLAAKMEQDVAQIVAGMKTLIGGFNVHDSQIAALTKEVEQLKRALLAQSKGALGDWQLRPPAGHPFGPPPFEARASAPRPRATAPRVVDGEVEAEIEEKDITPSRPAATPEELSAWHAGGEDA